jgi:SAM-dependent methyltransferase
LAGIKERLQRFKAGISQRELLVLRSHREFLAKIYNSVRSFIFDKRFHVDTRSDVLHKDLFSDLSDSESRATRYGAVPFKFLEIVVRECKDFFPAAFVDVGCGRGRACFYMANLRRYSRIIGIELSPRLVEDARRNLASYSKHTKMANIEFLIADARHFALPDTRALVFLFNPFDGVILGEFIQYNLDHFRQHRSRVAYLYDRHWTVLSNHGFAQLFRDDTHKISLWELSQ